MNGYPHHPGVALICPACAGAKGGRSRSAAKLAAQRRNARKGGWPKGRKRKPQGTS